MRPRPRRGRSGDYRSGGRVGWQPTDLWEALEEAEHDLNTAYRENGRERPIWDLTEPDTSHLPRHLAPFWCRCGGAWHVRRELDNHHCQYTE